MKDFEKSTSACWHYNMHISSFLLTFKNFPTCTCDFSFLKMSNTVSSRLFVLMLADELAFRSGPAP